MTNTLEKIQQEELQLERDLEQLEDEEKRLKQLEEEYHNFFHHTSSIYAEMEEQFLTNDFGWQLRYQSETLRQHNFTIFSELEEEQQRKSFIGR
ncbi:hypothetical protein [Enterococcus sp. LJL51]|uniref:hypothetical protein n=1 Tax=Enterococcus sp. LJL51 TaxID=3416656 RepID=UPI003CF03984